MKVIFLYHHGGHFPYKLSKFSYEGHFLLGHFPFRAFSVLPKMALFHPKYAHSFLAAAACSLNRSPFSISSLNHHSSLSKGPKLYACQSGPLSKDEVDDWHRMKCHLGILTRSWESECTMYLGQGICIKWHLSNWCCCDKERINVNLVRILIALLCFF